MTSLFRLMITGIIFTVGIHTLGFAATDPGAKTSVPLQKKNACFTPQHDCIHLIVNAINLAQDSLLIQAFDFRSAPIIRAIIAAKIRGVEVKAILDKRQWVRLRYSGSRTLVNAHIPVWVEYRPHRAQNNVIIIDKKLVITGSLNFTDDAQKRHAASLLVIKDKSLAKQFVENWQLRQKLSKRIIFHVKGRLNRNGQNHNSQRSGIGASPNGFYKLFIQIRN